jgi:hypothetical protein
MGFSLQCMDEIYGTAYLCRLSNRERSLVSVCEKVSITGMRFIEYKLLFIKKSATILCSTAKYHCLSAQFVLNRRISPETEGILTASCSYECTSIVLHSPILRCEVWINPKWRTRSCCLNQSQCPRDGCLQSEISAASGAGCITADS